MHMSADVQSSDIFLPRKCQRPHGIMDGKMHHDGLKISTLSTPSPIIHGNESLINSASQLSRRVIYQTHTLQVDRAYTKITVLRGPQHFTSRYRNRPPAVCSVLYASITLSRISSKTGPVCNDNYFEVAHKTAIKNFVDVTVKLEFPIPPEFGNIAAIIFPMHSFNDSDVEIPTRVLNRCVQLTTRKAALFKARSFPEVDLVTSLA